MALRLIYITSNKTLDKQFIKNWPKLFALILYTSVAFIYFSI